MGVTAAERRPTAPVTGLARHLRPLGWANLAANVLLVLTGGAVRLTGSGLGCPTWPRCDRGSLVPRGALSTHTIIEFGNRTLTFVLAAVAIATVIAAVSHARQTGRRDLRTLAIVVALSIPAQAVLGGITVLTKLNPWVVSLHLLASLAIISAAVVFLYRLAHGPRVATPMDVRGRLAWGTYAAAWAVLYLGTVTTGSGPNAGDRQARRTGLNIEQVAQLHADLVFLLVGLTVGLLALARVRRAAATLLAVELGQGVVGFVQYFSHLPVAIVLVHMLGSALTVAAATWALLSARDS